MKLLTSFFVASLVTAQETSYAESYDTYEYTAGNYYDDVTEAVEVAEAAEVVQDGPGAGQKLNRPNRNKNKQNDNRNTYNANAGNTYSGNNSNTGTSGNTGNSYGGANGGATTQAPTQLKCWHCEADSYELCGQTGYEETCHSNQEVCELVIRQRMGYITQIHMGCKQRQACENNRQSNFQNPNPDYTQCRPEAGYTHSVCRQCCDSDNCTKTPTWWYPASRDEWSY